MDRGQPAKVSVIKKYLTFKGDTGKFTYYDKEFEGEEKNIETPLHNDPNGLILLSTGFSIVGFDMESESKVYSNEVQKLSQELVVRSFKSGELIRGKYADIKDKINAKGWNLHLCLTFLDGDEVNHVSFKSSAYFAVSEALKKIDINKFKIKLIGFDSETRGQITFKVPKLEAGGSISTEEDALAIEKLDLIKHNRGVFEEPVEEDKDEPMPVDDDLPF